MSEHKFKEMNSDCTEMQQEEESGKGHEFDEAPEENCETDGSKTIDYSEQSPTDCETDSSAKEEFCELNKELLKSNEHAEIAMEYSDYSCISNLRTDNLENKDSHSLPEQLISTPNNCMKPSMKNVTDLSNFETLGLPTTIQKQLTKTTAIATPHINSTKSIHIIKKPVHIGKQQNGFRVVTVPTRVALPQVPNEKHRIVKIASKSVPFSTKIKKIKIVSENSTNWSLNKPCSEMGNTNVKTSKSCNVSDGNIIKNLGTTVLEDPAKRVSNAISVIDSAEPSKNINLIPNSANMLNLTQSTVILPVKNVTSYAKGPAVLSLKDSNHYTNLKCVPQGKMAASESSSNVINSTRTTQVKGSNTATFVPITTSSILPMLYGLLQSSSVIVDGQSGINTDTTSMTINGSSKDTGTSVVSQCIRSKSNETNMLMASKIIPDDDTCIPLINTACGSNTGSNILYQALEASNITVDNDQLAFARGTEQDPNPLSNCDTYRKNDNNDLVTSASESLDCSKTVKQVTSENISSNDCSKTVKQVISENISSLDCSKTVKQVISENISSLDCSKTVKQVISENISSNDCSKTVKQVISENLDNQTDCCYDNSVSEEGNIPTVFVVGGEQVVGSNVESELQVMSTVENQVVTTSTSSDTTTINESNLESLTNSKSLRSQEEEIIPTENTDYINQSRIFVLLYHQSSENTLLCPLLEVSRDLILCKTVIPEIVGGVDISSLSKNKISIPASQISTPVNLNTVRIVQKEKLTEKFLMIKAEAGDKYNEHYRRHLQYSKGFNNVEVAEAQDVHSSSDDKITGVRYLIDVGTLKSTKFHLNQICPECGIYFMDKDNLRSHLSQHSGQLSIPPDPIARPSNPTTRLIKCSHCDQEFCSIESRNEHERNVHCNIKLKETKCHYCDQIISYNTIYELERHYKFYHRNRPYKKYTRPYQCELCSSRFTHKRGLYWHQQKSFICQKEFHCHKCHRRSFPTREKLENHLLCHKYSNSELLKHLTRP